MNRMPGFVTVALLAMAQKIMEQQPDQILHDGNSDYLLRWHLEKTRTTGSVYIHKILRSDKDTELHDHPGDNMSIILDGEMIEVTDAGNRILRSGDVVLRSAEFKHRLVLERPVTTIWIMGERTREWGFWLEDGTFIPSQKFFDLRYGKAS